MKAGQRIEIHEDVFSPRLKVEKTGILIRESKDGTCLVRIDGCDTLHNGGLTQEERKKYGSNGSDCWWIYKERIKIIGTKKCVI